MFVLSGTSIIFKSITNPSSCSDGFNPPTPLHNEIYNDKNTKM